MSASTTRNQPDPRLYHHFSTRFSLVLLITALLLVGCTRDEVFSAVSTAVAESQMTRAAAQTRESNSPTTIPFGELVEGAAEATNLPALTELSVTVPVVENEPSATPDAATHIATPAAPEETPTATLLPITPTLAPTLGPTNTPRPTLTPSPTPLAELMEQEGAELLLVAGGPFEMGVEATTLLVECNIFRSGCQESWFAASEPPHSLMLNPFYIDTTEVTNQAYVTFLNSLGGHESRCLEQSCITLASSRVTVDETGTYQVAEAVADYPITGVSWYGAAAYCEWRGGRLPSEAEWEMAASWDVETETKRLYPWGDSFDGTLVNSCDASCEQPQANSDFDDGFAQEASVTSLENGRSPVGAYHMGGNVWEWVADWYDAAYYGNDSPAPGGPAEGEDKVVRGGSWFDTGNFTAATIRFPSPPSNTDGSIGFRCAADSQ